MAQDNTLASVVDNDDNDPSVHAAAAKIEELLSDSEDPQTSAAHPTKKGKSAPKPAPVEDDDEEDEPLDNPLVDDEDDDEQVPIPVDEEDEPEEEDEPAAPASKALVTITVDGEEQQVPLDEALAGYSRTASFTKKAQKLADERRDFEATRTAKEAEIRAQSEHYAKRLKDLESALTQEEPNWDQIRRETPEQFSDIHAAWQIHQSNLAKLRNEREAEEAKLATQNQAAHQGRVKRERDALVAAVPEWADQSDKGKAFRKAVHDYGIAQGFSEKELQDVADHRAFKLLISAFRYDQAVADKAARVAKGKGKVAALQQSLTPAAKNASGNKRTTQKTIVTELKARAKKSGSVQDAAAAIEAMM